MGGWKSLVSARSISDYRRALSPTDCGRSPHAEGAEKENGRFVPLFGFANGLLAFLALAAVLDFLPVLRHRRAPSVWWGEERLLFTTRYASVRQKYGAWAFLLGVMVYEFIVVFNNSMARENWPWLQTRVSPVLDWVMYLCFGFKILLGTKYNGRSMVCAGLLYFVARWVYFNGQNIWWLGLCVALLAAKDVPLRRVMKAFLACGVPTLALVELLHFAGIIAPDAASERNGSYRLMFGYGHPNTFGGVMFGLLLAWVLLRRTRLTWPELAGVAAVGVFLMVGPKSRSAALCTFLLVLLLALAKLRTRRGLHPAADRCSALRGHGAGAGRGQLYFTAVRRKNRAVGQRHRPRLAEEARRPADLPHLAGMGGIPGVRHKNCGPNAPGLARAGQYFCVSALPDRPRDGRAGLCTDDDGAVRLCPTRGSGRPWPAFWSCWPMATWRARSPT